MHTKECELIKSGHTFGRIAVKGNGLSDQVCIRRNFESKSIANILL